MAITKRTFTVQLPALSVAVALTAIALAACGTDGPTTPTRTFTATVTRSATPSTAAPTSVDNTADQSDHGSAADAAPVTATSTPTPCGPIADAAARIADASARIAPPSRTQPYRWQAIRSNMSTCNQLSWAELTTASGTASSADQLLLFGPDGTWLGTGIRCNMSLAWVVGSGADHVDVNYSYDQTPAEGTANASGRALIRFRWNGSRVVMEGTLPAELMSDQCSGQQ